MSSYLYLAHHGIKGQRWGVRRYQNPDGTLTIEGRKRYNRETGEYEEGKTIYGMTKSKDNPYSARKTASIHNARTNLDRRVAEYDAQRWKNFANGKSDSISSRAKGVKARWAAERYLSVTGDKAYKDYNRDILIGGLLAGPIGAVIYSNVTGTGKKYTDRLGEVMDRSSRYVNSEATESGRKFLEQSMPEEIKRRPDWY